MDAGGFGGWSQRYTNGNGLCARFTREPTQSEWDSAESSNCAAYPGPSGHCGAVCGTSFNYQAEYMVNEIGTLTGCWQKEGSYVTARQGASSCKSNVDSIEFGITCSTAGTTTISAEIIAPDGNANSFWVKVDSGSSTTWSTGVGKSWFWASHELDTAEGAQLLKLVLREDGIKIRKISVRGACEIKAAYGGRRLEDFAKVDWGLSNNFTVFV